MIRGTGFLHAGLLLVMTAGCSLDSMTLSFNGGTKDFVYPGKLENVFTQIQLTLPGLGVTAKTERYTEMYRITGVTPRGQKFVLTLKSVKAERPELEQTSLRIDWEKTADDQMWLQLLKALQTPAPGQMAGMQPGMAPQQSFYGMQTQQGMAPQQPYYGMQGQQNVQPAQQPQFNVQAQARFQ